jgi:hypothetical protein
MRVDWTTRPLRSYGFVPCVVCRLEKVRKSLRGRSGFIGRLFTDGLLCIGAAAGTH